VEDEMATRREELLKVREKIGIDTLERYTGSDFSQFQPYVLLTNFPRYVEMFALKFKREITQGSAMSASHAPKEKISIINFGVGSPVAALIMELLSFVKPRATLMLGLCGGLREEYEIGDYFNPVAAIREEGTSLAYLPERCPSLSSFLVQRYVCEELERNNLRYHTGVIHTTNVRMWEFKEDFVQKLVAERSQAIDMEAATLFTVGFVNKIAIGALVLISDLPLEISGIKTKASAIDLLHKYGDMQVDLGINVLRNMRSNGNKILGYNF
jgi:AMP nucleosidase